MTRSPPSSTCSGRPQPAGRSSTAARAASSPAALEAQAAAPDPVAAALARAERDFVRAELAVVAAGRPPVAEIGDRARRLAVLRIRTGLDAIGEGVPELADHLRR